MKAQPTAQLALLDLQALDTRLSQLEHQRQNIPEAGELARLTAQARALADTMIAVETQVSDLARAQTKAEADVAAVRTRIERDQALLLSGTAGSAKALTDLQRELESLQRRVGDLEDVELEYMERLEAAEGRLNQLRASSSDLAGQLDRCKAVIATVNRDIDLEVERVAGERARVVAGVDPLLAALYERIRRNNPTAAAALHRGRCQGCQMQLTPAEISRIRAAALDEVCRCEECQAILVRTAESAL